MLADARLAQHLEDLLGHARGQFHSGVILVQVDLADEAALDAGLVGDRADDVLGHRILVAAYIDAVALHPAFGVVAPLLQDLIAILARGALAAREVRR